MCNRSEKDVNRVYTNKSDSPIVIWYDSKYHSHLGLAYRLFSRRLWFSFDLFLNNPAFCLKLWKLTAMAIKDTTAHDQLVLCHGSHEPFQPQRSASFSAN